VNQTTEKATEKTAPSSPDSENENGNTESSGANEASAIQALETQIKEKEQKYLYLYADFENYKKRVLKERADLLKFGWESAAREIIEIVDNLERALEHMPKSPNSSETLQQGLRMVLNQFKAALEKQGIQQIDTGKDKSFDPNLHEAVAHLDSDQPEGKIIREETRGYTLHGRLLRPSRVVVSSGKNTSPA
jgi:molecular chaperone GrpE